MNSENRRIILVLTAFCIVFVGLVGYLSYFQVFRAEAVKNNSYNKRLWINEENVLRGSIMDRNGNILAYSEKTQDTNTRYYKYGNLYSHVIGYSYREYGKAGLELQYNNVLLDINENAAIEEFKNLVLPTSEGNDIRLTIDHSTQEKARNLLNGRKGSIVLMNPKNGEVYAMVSLPDFDTSNLNDNWKDITENPDSPFLNRATQGLYTPGSVFKIVTSLAALESMDIDLEYECLGSTNIDGYILKDYNEIAHGMLDLHGAFVKSCNTYFGEKALEIGKDRFGTVADRFMINKEIDFDLPVKTSQFPYKGSIGNTEIAAAGIGQGKVLVTPLNMAMIASSIANDGDMVRPILVKEISKKDGKILRSMTTDTISNVTSPSLANDIKDMMVDAVASGTGSNARIRNVIVAGKTGTAENPSGNSHSWFAGFAPAEEPRLAIAVILEEAGVSGGQGAAPIARDLFIHGLNNIDF
ncbi:MAG TPA: penicillin-binding transpeptidase domain-containing protein [Tissierellaceae bacterium]|nr:penicillin-binding transpeptidase domain-containing protein [Tissierellaceae bacterium]